MQILKPIVHETIWGGTKLAPYSDSSCTRIGHLYCAVDTNEFCSEIIAGSSKGRNLHEWFTEHKHEYGLGQYEQLPFLTALVDAAQDLSIQVHPDDEMARKLVGHPFGKNESFYIINPPSSGSMYSGCRVKDIKEMRRFISQGRIADAIDSIPVEIGDYISIPGGTLHAATAGSLIFEIEENCEVTYRFWDFDRTDAVGEKRPLQLEQAMACLHVGKKSAVRRYNPPNPICERMYHSWLVHGSDIESFRCERTFALATLIYGEEQVDIQDEQETAIIHPGTTILLTPGEAFCPGTSDWIVCSPSLKVS